MDLALLSRKMAVRPRSRILVLNPGSSTLKASVVEPPGRVVIASTTTEWGARSDGTSDDANASGGRVRSDAIDRMLEAIVAGHVDLASITAVGYRVVHGGTELVHPTLIDDDVVTVIAALADLAPLHNLIAAETIAAGRLAIPGVPHVAVFDTAFHAGLPPAAFRYPVPERWFREWGVRRFGFHGISVAWSVRRAAELFERPVDDLRLVVAHLGAGCSITATDGGRSVDTSMGYTPLEGVVMATRSGSIDPGILIRLLDEERLSLAELAEDLEHRSGLLGVSARSGDVRDLLAAEEAGDEASKLALTLFVRRAAAGIAAAASCLPGLDGVVFTGGIGEHAGLIRARIVERLAVLGVAPIEPGDVASDAVLSVSGRLPAVLRIAAREDLVISDAVAQLLDAPTRSAPD